jgi:hypothetical protein
MVYFIRVHLLLIIIIILVGLNPSCLVHTDRVSIEFDITLIVILIVEVWLNYQAITVPGVEPCYIDFSVAYPTR